MKIAVIVSGGGHLDEMLAISEAFQGHEMILVSYQQKSLTHYNEALFQKVYLLSLFGSSGFWLYVSLFFHFFYSFWILFKEQPDVLFSTGSEIAVLPFWMGKKIFHKKCLFLETVTRTQQPSKTAIWVRSVRDLLLVQWPAVAEHLGPKARRVGRIL